LEEGRPMEESQAVMQSGEDSAMHMCNKAW